MPGVPIPASPIDDFVDRGTDTADVFAVTLAAGELIEADLIGESGDFDLELHAPGTPSIWTGSTWVLEGSYGDYATESISHQATVAGTYYLVVTAYKGGDDYILIWSIDGETPDGPTVVEARWPASSMPRSCSPSPQLCRRRCLLRSIDSVLHMPRSSASGGRECGGRDCAQSRTRHSPRCGDAYRR